MLKKDIPKAAAGEPVVSLPPGTEPPIPPPGPALPGNRTPACRHCGNTRVPKDPTICLTCIRCTDPGGCGHSPTCNRSDIVEVRD